MNDTTILMMSSFGNQSTLYSLDHAGRLTYEYLQSRRFKDIEAAANWLVKAKFAKSTHSAANLLNQAILGIHPCAYGFRVKADKDLLHTKYTAICLGDQSFDTIKLAAEWLVEQGKSSSKHAAIINLRAALKGTRPTAYGYVVRSYDE